MEKFIRIFLADGSRDFIASLRSGLENQPDFRVVETAFRGDTALQYLLEHPVDVLMTDLLLPGLDGLSLLRRLKAAEKMPRTIVLSAFVSDYMVHAVSLLGVLDFIQKPPSGSVLPLRIREAADGRGHFSAHACDASIREALARFPIPPNLNGSAYLEEAVRRTLLDRGVLRGITKILYPDLARHFGTTPLCVERSIRSAIETGWKRGSQEARRLYFGHLFDEFGEAPGNARFIGALVSYIELGGTHWGTR